MHDEIIAYVQGLKAAGKKIPVSFLKAYRGEKAEIIAANYYRSLGYLVEDFSEVPGHPFDLKVTRPDGTSFNVEVKGTYSIHERKLQISGFLNKLEDERESFDVLFIVDLRRDWLFEIPADSCGLFDIPHNNVPAQAQIRWSASYNDGDKVLRDNTKIMLHYKVAA